jgi:hypothetical protein
VKEPTVEALWKTHLAAKFPDSCYGRDPGGIDLVQLDANIAGCVDTYLTRRRRLDPHRISMLGICYRHARAVIPGLRGTSRTHFERLEKMAGSVLQEVEKSTRRK